MVRLTGLTLSIHGTSTIFPSTLCQLSDSTAALNWVRIDSTCSQLSWMALPSSCVMAARSWNLSMAPLCCDARRSSLACLSPSSSPESTKRSSSRRMKAAASCDPKTAS